MGICNGVQNSGYPGNIRKNNIYVLYILYICIIFIYATCIYIYIYIYIYILEKHTYIGCPHPHKSELRDGTHGAGPLRVVLNSNSFADNF